MRLRYKIGLVIVTGLLVACFMTYQSYALWIASFAGQDNVVDVGCFQVNFEELGESIKLSNTYPVSDTKGLSGTPYSFKITNTCDIDSHYSVTLNTLTTNGINTDNIKFAIHTETGVKPTVGINLKEFSLTHLNEKKEKIKVTNLDESIILASGDLGQNESVTYHLYLWLDEKAGNDIMGRTFQSSVEIISDATTKQP